MSKKNIHQKASNQTIKVKILTLKDLAICIELDRISFNGIWNTAQWKKELDDSSRICLGMITGNKLIAIACGWCILDEINITFVAVDPLYQMQGIGKRIVSCLIERSVSEGIKIVNLEVKEKNSAALSLYKSLDFKKIGVRENFYKDGSNAIIFQYIYKNQALRSQ